MRAIVQIALAAILTPAFNGVVFLAAAASTAIVTGLAGGKLGDVLKAAAIAGATAFAFYEVGNLTGHNPTFGTPAYAENVAGHAAVGCLSAVASGGKCESGALSAGVAAAAAPLVGDVVKNAPNADTATLEGSAISGVIGGVASVAGGGKFADGAVTAAFSYLFNSAAQKPGGGFCIAWLAQSCSGPEFEGGSMPSNAAESDFSQPRATSGEYIFRTGSQTDNSLSSDETGVSFRDSISSSADGEQVFAPGAKIFAVDTTKLPPGSVVPDGDPAGHVSVTASPSEIRSAIVPQGPTNPLSGLKPLEDGSSYRLPKN